MFEDEAACPSDPRFFGSFCARIDDARTSLALYLQGHPTRFIGDPENVDPASCERGCCSDLRRLSGRMVLVLLTVETGRLCTNVYQPWRATPFHRLSLSLSALAARYAQALCPTVMFEVAAMASVESREVRPEHGGYLWGLCLASVLIATVTLVLRLWSRLLNRSQRFGSDDWMAIAAWPFVVGQGFLIMFCMRWGVGVHSDQLTDQEYAVSNRLLLAILIVYYFNMDLIRISLSLYYRRIFASSRTFKRFVWAYIGLNVVWHMLIIFGAIFQCSTPSAMWDKSIQAHCDPPAEHQYFCSSSSIAMDVLALLLPVPMIWKLHLKSSKKWEVLAIFFIGYCVPIMTTGRLIATLKTADALNADPSWNWPKLIVWLVLEVMAAYLGVCTPSVMFLARRWRSSGLVALFSRHAATRSSLESDPNVHIDLAPITKSEADVNVVVSEIRPSDEGRMTPPAIGNIPAMGIVQTRTYTVTREECSA